MQSLTLGCGHGEEEMMRDTSCMFHTKDVKDDNWALATINCI